MMEIPLGLDKAHDFASEAHFIETDMLVFSADDFPLLVFPTYNILFGILKNKATYSILFGI